MYISVHQSTQVSSDTLKVSHSLIRKQYPFNTQWFIMVKTERIAIRLTEEDTKRFQQLSDNTGLKKSTLVKLMLGGTLRDLKHYKKSQVSYLLAAWSSKSYETMIEDIDIY